ncbi:hypothetical protein DFH09DRAFT_1109909 [Mycena vulgaris]|nr:hypothetical protein DFH09DRAFT_1109909 [Mycena vulgaris]
MLLRQAQHHSSLYPLQSCPILHGACSRMTDSDLQPCAPTQNLPPPLLSDSGLLRYKLKFSPPRSMWWCCSEQAYLCAGKPEYLLMRFVSEKLIEVGDKMPEAPNGQNAANAGSKSPTPPNKSERLGDGSTETLDPRNLDTAWTGKTRHRVLAWKQTPEETQGSWLRLWDERKLLPWVWGGKYVLPEDPRELKNHAEHCQQLTLDLARDALSNEHVHARSVVHARERAVHPVICLAQEWEDDEARILREYLELHGCGAPKSALKIRSTRRSGHAARILEQMGMSYVGSRARCMRQGREARSVHVAGWSSRELAEDGVVERGAVCERKDVFQVAVQVDWRHGFDSRCGVGRAQGAEDEDEEVGDGGTCVETESRVVWTNFVQHEVPDGVAQEGRGLGVRHACECLDAAWGTPSPRHLRHCVTSLSIAEVRDFDSAWWKFMFVTSSRHRESLPFQQDLPEVTPSPRAKGFCGCIDVAACSGNLSGSLRHHILTHFICRYEPQYMQIPGASAAAVRGTCRRHFGTLQWQSGGSVTCLRRLMFTISARCNIVQPRFKNKFKFKFSNSLRDLAYNASGPSPGI